MAEIYVELLWKGLLNYKIKMEASLAHHHVYIVITIVNFCVSSAVHIPGIILYTQPLKTKPRFSILVHYVRM